MGKATRWLKALFGIKKKVTPQQKEPSNSELNIIHNPTTIPPNISPAEAAWLRSFLNESENEQHKHAIAVAAATTAAADPAVAAAQASVTVVRLTSQGRGSVCVGGGKERLAAVRIQTVFRGYLARKALRALKGLVKLQAHVRGYLVRKQATAALHSMQALIRAQATILSKRGRNNHNLINNNARSEFGAQKSMERFDEPRSEHAASVHSRRLSASLDATFGNNLVEESPKIVEVDTLNGICRPKSKSRKTDVSSVSDFGDELPYQILYSPLPLWVPPGLSITESRNFEQESEWGLMGDECRFATTAHSTPRFESLGGSNGYNVASVTPVKSVCGDSFFRQYGNCPNFMVNTQSFKAKLRSLSAPKQRPEPGGAKKRLSLNELMESRSSLSGVKMQRSCSRVQDAINFKNAVMGRLERSFDFSREIERKRW